MRYVHAPSEAVWALTGRERELSFHYGIDPEVMDWQMGGAYPLVVEIPGIGGHLEGRTSLIDSIRESVGLHV